ncbi:dTMP kinase [Bifidobacterium bombi]|uniref:Thymidylate kinase n=1 Tax=Bifidobacterium bombi DSM 19703 TaxID=1341695 RepID=A0A080N3L6_9BIFI|nr:dTMP kinase [Bifidobacterium bombi]KFF31621.1 thymidylate kinase [Bifidobacterium bombi DSM 19703]
MSGLFISFEGVDGAGKTTQVQRLRDYAEAQGREVVVTREPGGTALGCSLRELLLQERDTGDVGDTAGCAIGGCGGGRSDCGVAVGAGGGVALGKGGVADGAEGRKVDTADIAPRTEALLFAADRAQHVAEVIAPALARGAVVVSDRYIDSSLAYQAGGRELTVNEVRELNVWATRGLLPDRTYLLDMDPEASHLRFAHREDRIESVGLEFQRRTREEFIQLAGADPDRFRVIDASQSVERVWDDIVRDFNGLLRN